MKNCGVCGKQVANNAKKCKFCGNAFGKNSKSIDTHYNYALASRRDRIACCAIDFLLTLTVIGRIINFLYVWIDGRTLSYKLFKIKIDSNKLGKLAIGIRFLIYLPTVFVFVWILMENCPSILGYFCFGVFLINLIEFFQKGPTFIDQILGIRRYSSNNTSYSSNNAVSKHEKKNENSCPICRKNKEANYPICDTCIENFFNLLIGYIEKKCIEEKSNFSINNMKDVQKSLLDLRGHGTCFTSCIICDSDTFNGDFLCYDCIETFMYMYMKFDDLNAKRKYGKTALESFKNALLLTKGKNDLLKMVHDTPLES